MRYESTIKRIASLFAGFVGYPPSIQRLINIAPVDATIRDDGGQIERGCRLEGGRIQIGKDSKISKGTLVRGNVTIGDGARVGTDSVLDGDIRLGKRTNLVERVEVIGNVSIGKYCAIARRTTFQGVNHPMAKPGMQMRFYRELLGENLEHTSNGPIEVGSDVWIGVDSIILSGVTIGHGAVVGAGSIVTKDVAPYSVVAGVPAEHKRWRFDEDVRKQLLELEWWEWEARRIRANADFFRSDLRTVSDISPLLSEEDGSD